MHRGLIAHTIFNKGMSGMKDFGGKQEKTLSLSYPMGRVVKVYNGGFIRDWNVKSNTGGEGIWILSKTGGLPHVSTAGSTRITKDVVGLKHDPSNWPEAYLGAVHHEHYALSIRKADGTEAEGTEGVDVLARTNWWPASGGIDAALAPIPENQAVFIWNFRYGRYNSGTTFKERILGGELAQMSAPLWVEALSEDNFPELIAISRAKSKDTGLQWTRKWYQWGHADYDDFLINETVVANTLAERAEGVYILFENRFASHFTAGYRGTGARWNIPRPWSQDDHARSTLAANYLDGVSTETFLAGGGKPAGSAIGADLAARGHAMLYAHDGESTHIDNPALDVGDPFRLSLTSNRIKNSQTWVRDGMLLHGQYFGMGVVDALPPFNTYGGRDPEAYVPPHDNPDTPIDESLNQPASVTISRAKSISRYDHPASGSDTDAVIYDFFTTAGYPDEPEAAHDYRQFMVFGPYDLNPGEKCKVVVAYVGATAADAPKYADYKRYAQPFTFSWILLSDGAGREPVSFTERQREIPLGEDAMFRHFQRAIDVYHWGYDVPNQPPNIKLASRSNLDGNTEIRWSAFGETSEDPDYAGEEARDLRGYRIYRSTTENQGPWEFVTEFSFDDARARRLPQGVRNMPDDVFSTAANIAFPHGISLRENKYLSGVDPNAGAEIRGLYTYTDKNLRTGFPAWYAVRYYDAGHADWDGKGSAIPVLESAPGPSGGAIIGSSQGIVPIVPGDTLFDNLDAQVKVVPNPYRAGDDLHTYDRSLNLRFINLPGRCQLDLYTVSGERFWTFFNTDLTRGEVTYNQITEFTRGRAPSSVSTGLAPGIYFWKVTSLMPVSEGKEQSGTFVVIK